MDAFLEKLSQFKVNIANLKFLNFKEFAIAMISFGALGSRICIK